MSTSAQYAAFDTATRSFPTTLKFAQKWVRERQFDYFTSGSAIVGSKSAEVIQEAPSGTSDEMGAPERTVLAWLLARSQETSQAA
eukprot:1825904-Amphidinium_carterae.1